MCVTNSFFHHWQSYIYIFSIYYIPFMCYIWHQSVVSVSTGRGLNSAHCRSKVTWTNDAAEILQGQDSCLGLPSVSPVACATWSLFILGKVKAASLQYITNSGSLFLEIWSSQYTTCFKRFGHLWEWELGPFEALRSDLPSFGQCGRSPAPRGHCQQTMPGFSQPWASSRTLHAMLVKGRLTLIQGPQAFQCWLKG